MRSGRNFRHLHSMKYVRHWQKCGLTTKHIESQVRVLSGGEQAKVRLCKLINRDTNILLLDEPTNHLDMESITALNNGLIKFPGVILFASHDHQFVQTTANRIMEILPDGRLIDKITTYDEYLASDENGEKNVMSSRSMKKTLPITKYV